MLNQPETIALGFNKLYIIESLTSDDERTGEMLYENSLKRTEREHTSLTIEYHYVQTKDEFLLLLNQILTNVQTGKEFPIMHIEMHGTNSHLELESGENMTWKEFAEQTRKINYAINNTLILILISCYSLQMTRHLSHEKIAAFRVIIAPNESVLEKDIKDSVKRFYLKMFHNFDMLDALDELNNHESPGPFSIFEAKELFIKQWDSYKRQFEDPESKEAVMQKLIKAANDSNLLEENNISEDLFKESVLLAVAERDKEQDRILEHYLILDKENDMEKFKKCVEYYEEIITLYNVKPEYLSLDIFQNNLSKSYPMRVDEKAHNLITLEATPLQISTTEQVELQQYMKVYDFPQYLVDATKGLSDLGIILETIYMQLKIDEDIINGALELMYQKYPELREKMKESKKIANAYKKMFSFALAHPKSNRDKLSQYLFNGL